MSNFCIHPFARTESSWKNQVVERYSGQIGNASEGKGYIHATHHDMSKFSSDLETGYKRVVDVIEDFVVEATKAMESKRLPRSISATGQYTGSSIFNTNLSQPNPPIRSGYLL